MPTLSKIIGSGTSTASASSSDISSLRSEITSLKLTVAKKADVQALEDAIALLEETDTKQMITVVRDHAPGDLETDGSWHLWRAEIPEPPNIRINFYLWMGGQYSYAIMPEDIVMPWENLAVPDPTRQTYSIQIEGVAVEYNKTPIAVLDNQTFNPPALIFNIKDADTVFSNISWKALNNTGREIGNGGRTALAGENLTIIQVNPAMAGGESTVVAKVIFIFTRLDATTLNYEIVI